MVNAIFALSKNVANSANTAKTPEESGNN